MKHRNRWLTLGLSLCLLLALCSCVGGEVSNTYTVEKHGTIYTVDQAAATIHDGKYTYQFTFDPYGDGYKAEITYPNGATYYWTNSGSFGHGGWSEDYDEVTYADGSELVDVIEEGRPKRSDPKPVGIILLLIAVGLFNVTAPSAAWYLEYGWRYKNAEPSELALAANRIGGAIALVAAVLMLLFG